MVVSQYRRVRAEAQQKDVVCNKTVFRRSRVSEAKWSPLNDVAELFTGYPFRAAVRNAPGGTLPVVQLQDLAFPAGDLPESIVRVSNADGRYDNYLLEPTDLLFQARGARHAAALVRLKQPAISLPGLHIIRPDPKRVLPEYLVWCINHPSTQAAIAALAQGTHQPFVSKQSLAKVQIPVPPMTTQHQIAEIDQLRAEERRLAAELAEAKDTLVHSATWQVATGQGT
jgi:type I restriction modification DNA specificity protein